MLNISELLSGLWVEHVGPCSQSASLSAVILQSRIIHSARCTSSEQERGSEVVVLYVNIGRSCKKHAACWLHRFVRQQYSFSDLGFLDKYNPFQVVSYLLRCAAGFLSFSLSSSIFSLSLSISLSLSLQ